jgi:hypothetical protein
MPVAIPNENLIKNLSNILIILDSGYKRPINAGIGVLNKKSGIAITIAFVGFKLITREYHPKEFVIIETKISGKLRKYPQHSHNFYPHIENGC